MKSRQDRVDRNGSVWNYDCRRNCIINMYNSTHNNIDIWIRYHKTLAITLGHCMVRSIQ